MSAPAVTVHNRQRAVKIDVEKLQAFAERAGRISSKPHPPKKTASKQLAEIHVVLISDRRMSELHREFLEAEGSTDVITFQHGEIFISAETARRQARTFGTSLQDEIRLYLVHGLLHLRGFDDKTLSGARVMRAMQERIARKAAEM